MSNHVWLPDELTTDGASLQVGATQGGRETQQNTEARAVHQVEGPLLHAL